MSEFTQLQDRLRGALNKAEGGNATVSNRQDDGIRVGWLKDELAKAFAHDRDSSAMFTKQIEDLMKTLGTTNINALRIVSMSDRTVVKRPEDVRFANFLKLKPTKAVTDIQHRIKERDALTALAPAFNPNGAMPAIRQSTYHSKYNTVTTVGNRTKQGWFAKDLTRAQGADEDVEQDNIDDIVNAIYRAEDQMLMSNQEVTSEAENDIPQLGGILNRTTTNVRNLGGDFTAAVLDADIKTLLDLFGWDKQLILFVGHSQVDNIDDVMINRYPGTDPMSHMEKQNRLLSEAMISGNVPYATVYHDRRSKPVPVVMNPTMPAGSALLMIADLPRLAEYKFQGVGGIHAAVLPEATMYDVSVIFKTFTLEDPWESSRFRYTNVS